MSRKKRAKWVDPRRPVSVTQVGKFKVTIYDQAAYDESLRLYPDSEEAARTPKKTKQPLPGKSKRAARYNWTKKLETPLPWMLPAANQEDSVSA